MLLLVGFAEDAGFAAIRDSKQEARWLREALGDADDPFGRMATGLADLALRRWAFDGGQLQTATVALVDQGTVTLRTQAAETSLSRAANALLGSGRSASSALPVSLLSSTPETDWSFVSGPVGAVVRAPSGRFSAMWTRVDDPGDERTPGEVAQAVTPHGAVLISCACDDSELVQQAANALALRLEQPEQVQPEAARFRELLGSASFDERQVAVLVLGRGAVVEGGGAQIVSAAGVDWTAAAPTAASSPTPTELQLPTDGGLFPPILSPPVPRVDAGRFDAGGVR